jgi:hypothetical protein
MWQTLQVLLVTANHTHHAPDKLDKQAVFIDLIFPQPSAGHSQLLHEIYREVLSLPASYAAITTTSQTNRLGGCIYNCGL